MSTPDEEFLDIQAEAQINQLMSQGKAREILDAYSEHNQSCAYIWSILQHVTGSDSDTICNGVKNFANNLINDWTK